MKRSLCILFCILFMQDVIGLERFPYDINFDVSMQTSLYPRMITSEWGVYAYEFFKSLYERNNPAHIIPSSEPIIERTIHQIWLGSEVPEKYKKWRESWQRYHPTWEYYLWTDADLAKFPLYNRDLYEAETNYGARSDIARYEILYQCGGVYVDIDGECVAPLDILHHCYDFYIGIQPLDTNILQLGIGIIGAARHHPLLKYVIDHLRDNVNVQQIIAKTGPIYFTQIFCGIAHNFPRCVALPASYFYPRGYNQKYENRNAWLCPESFAIHHWGGSWLRPEAFVQGR